MDSCGTLGGHESVNRFDWLAVNLEYRVEGDTKVENGLKLW
jgi:hypothetical protein